MSASKDDKLRLVESEGAKADLVRFVASAPEGMALLDRSLRFVVVNEAMAAINGIPAEEHEGRAVSEVLPVLDRQFDLSGAIRTVIDTGVPEERDIEGETPAAPGEVRVWRASWFPVREDEQVVAVGAIVREITSRRKTEDDLAEAFEKEREARSETEAAQERLNFIFQASTALFASPLDPALRLERLAQLAVPSLADWCVVERLDDHGMRERVAIVHWNPQRRDECRSLRGRVGSLGMDAGGRGFERVLRTGEPELVKDVASLRLPERYAEHRNLLETLGVRSYVIAPLRGHAGIAGAVMYAFSDSNRRYQDADLQLAAELAQRAAMAVENARLFKEAERAIRTRDELVSIASHDVRSPLAALSFRAALLRKKVRKGDADAAAIEEDLEKIESQVNVAVSLLEDLLSVTRLAAGKLELRLEEVDLQQLVREIAGRFEELLVAAGCELNVELEGPPVHGQWDRLRLEQVVTNLVSNAMKYGRGKPITLRVEGDGAFGTVHVRDAGIGIPLSEQPRIFERFGRATQEGRSGSHGLGLWIVKQIVDALGGRVSVSSRPGAGATFTVELPRSGPPAG